MPSEPGPGRVRLGVKLAIAAALFVMVVSLLPLGFASASPVPAAPLAVPGAVHTAPAATGPATSLATGPHTSATPASTVHPLTGSGTIQYYGNTTGFAVPSYQHEGCTVYAYTTYAYNYCYPQAEDPTLMNLGNGNVGISYQFNTNDTGTTCVGSGISASIHTAIGFSISSNGGASFGAPTVIANQSCTYLQSIEPAFASSGNNVYGVFVEENYTASVTTYYGAYGGSRPDSALGFTSSSNNGASFSVPRTIVTGGNITHPEMATFGDSIYVVYENMSTSTTTIPVGGPFCYGFCYPTITTTQIYYLYSTDGGATWSTPTAMVGLNSTLYGFSINAAVAVNATGTVAVSYFTNGTCVQYYYGCDDWGLDLVVLTSTSNGSTWNGPYTVARQVGISQLYWGYFYFQTGFWLPQDQIIFSNNGQTMDFVFAGLYNKSYVNYNYDDWCCGGIFFASGSVSGSGFTVTPVYTSYDPNTYDDMFAPSIGVNSGTLYISWTWNNETYCSTTTCPYTTGSVNQRLVTSTDGGATWTDPLIVAIEKGPYSFCTSACATGQFPGYQSSIAFNGTTPLIAYAFGEDSTSTTYVNSTSYYFYNTTYPVMLSVASPFSGPTVVLNLTENNLLPGTIWSFTVQGLTYSTTGTSFLITNMPADQPVTVVPDNLVATYGEQITPTSSVPSGVVKLSANGTVFFNYSLEFQLLYFENPLITPYMFIYFTYNGSYNYFYSDMYCYAGCYTYRDWCDPYTGCQSEPMSWWYPVGARITVTQETYGSAYNEYWNGTGNGSYTGAGAEMNITMDGAINETGWVGDIGVFNVSVNAVGLPSTSDYTFTFAGGTYSAGASTSVLVSNVTNGPYDVTNISATSTSSGWEYFGSPTPANPVIVPDAPIINLTFAYVDVGAAVGTITFHAVGLTSGTPWHFSFNGTEYSSNTPWINISAHPGTYATSAYPVVAANGSAGYAPSAVPTSWDVTTGTTYDISYAPAFQTVVTAGTGGTVSGTGRGTLWLANGTAASFHAVASAGYVFGGWTGSGLNSYSGPDSYANFTVVAPTTESASFYPLPQNRFNLTFVETGLNPGTMWTVYLSGQGYSTDQSVLHIESLYPCGPLGNYNLTIPYAYANGTALTRYVPGGYTSTVCTTGSTLVPLTFTPEYYLTLGGTAGGIAEAEVGSNTYTSSVWVENASSVLLAEQPSPNYIFLGWNGTGSGSYTGPTASVGIVMTNPLSEIAAFIQPYVPPPPTYWVDFHLTTPFLNGTGWTVHVGGAAYSATGNDLNVTNLTSNPSISVVVSTAYSPDGLVRYTPVGAPTTLQVTHNRTVSLSFSTSYWVSVLANFGGSIVAPSSGASGSWIASGQVLTINATPIAGYVFVGWTGTGAGSYTGPTQSSSFPIKGSIHEVASFAPAPPVAKSAAPSPWSAPTTWIALAIVGLIVGLVVGLLVGRRGGGPRPAVGDAAWSEEPASGEPQGEPTADPSSTETGGT